jgi:small-conductance mechanosensitive channel
MSRVLLVSLLIGVAWVAHGQEAAGEEWIPAGAVLARADALLGELEAARPAPAKQERLDDVEADLERRVPELEDLVARVDPALADAAPLEDLAELRGELDAEAAALEGWREELDAEAQQVVTRLEELTRAEALWSATLRLPETADEGEVVERHVRAALDGIAETSALLRAWRDRVLALEDRVAGHHTTLAAALARVDDAMAAQRATLLVPDRPPLWQTGLVDDLREQTPRVPGAIRDFSANTLDYVRRDPRPLILQLLLAALLALIFREAGRRARRRTEGEAEPADRTRVLERPLSIGLLLALLATAWLHPLAPRRFVQLLGLLALIPVARIVTHASEGVSRLLFVGLFAMVLLDRLDLAVQELPAVGRLFFLVELGLGLALAAFVMRRGGLPGSARRVRLGARLVALALAAALLAELGGWTALAALIGRGASVLALLAVYLWAAVVALDALLVSMLVASHWSGWQTAAQRRAGLVVRWLGAFVWLWVGLGTIGLREAATDSVRRLLEAGISVGALSLTLGGILAFTFTIVAAPLLARAIDFALQKGVYPRARLPRGMPYAMSTLVRYAVFTLAFIAALAAAGVELSQLSILLGGLGVGVGLGLQDIVRNFAAGLTLLFERRVHVGDVVQVPSGAIFGRVLEIGMRASLVRNWDGAEVVIPNADLVASAVTNWTLSDQLRRIELPVGVAYGSEPDKVVALLLGVARGHADVIEQPPPQVLFHGFGESSLDFLVRVWTGSDYDRTLAIRSELALATHRALAEAGITIPFPQRDLHLASVSDEVRAALTGRESA